MRNFLEWVKGPGLFLAFVAAFIYFLLVGSLTGIVCLVAVYVVFLAIYFFYKKVEGDIRKHNEYWKPCQHGIPAGLTADRCPECVRLKEEAAQKAEAERQEQERKRIVAASAARLQTSEIGRIKKSLLKSQDYLRSVSPQDFEDIVAELFRNIGYDVKQTPYTNDQGKDAIIFKDGKKALIECKRYALENKVGRPMLQKFYAAMREEHAGKGFFVSTGTFTSTAEAYASKYNIELINTDKLVLLMQEAYPDSGDDGMNEIKVTCLECGQVLLAPLNRRSVGKCGNGHIVKNDLDIVSISQMSIHPH